MSNLIDNSKFYRQINITEVCNQINALNFLFAEAHKK